MDAIDLSALKVCRLSPPPSRASQPADLAGQKGAGYVIPGGGWCKDPASALGGEEEGLSPVAMLAVVATGRQAHVAMRSW